MSTSTSSPPRSKPRCPSCWASSRAGPRDLSTAALAPGDLAVDRELADLAGGFRFLLDLTPVDLPEVRHRFEQDGRAPDFRYRELEDDPEVALKRLAQVPVQDVSDPMLANLLQAKQRELRLQLEMLATVAPTRSSR